MIGTEKYFRTIKLKNFLSFGEKGENISLESLNVLIGPNSSGKSNLIEAIGLLNAAPRDLMPPIRQGGGVGEWLYKGVRKSPVAEIEVTLNEPGNRVPLRYRIAFTEVNQRFELIDEVIERESKDDGRQEDVFFYRYQKGDPVLSAIPVSSDPGVRTSRTQRRLKREDLTIDQSILSQLRDPDLYPEITYISKQFDRMKLFRELNIGRYAPPRMPQKTDLPEDFLLEDAANLGLVINDLQNRLETKKTFMERLRSFNPEIEDLTTRIQGGTVQVFVHEKGLKHPIPATRLSDGTLRFVCLLAVLCHPNPPSVVCIEEPEIGLHPDVMPLIAELLVDASRRTQLFITTHSDALVSELTDMPESVIVCERDKDCTSLRKLDRDNLREWLEKYSLGELWRMGEIGGV